jgi:hypothetical protein
MLKNTMEKWENRLSGEKQFTKKLLFLMMGAVITSRSIYSTIICHAPLSEFQKRLP